MILIVRQAAKYIIMTSLSSDEVAAPTAILFAVGLDSSLWSSSLMYLLRCPALTSLGFDTCLSHAYEPNDNNIARICFFMKDLSGLV